jgi:hypothetical protein
MATTLESLPDAERAEFLSRLDAYGLNESAVTHADLVVPANTTMTLAAGDAHSFVRPQLLNTTDLDTLKRWIGVPDSLYADDELARTHIALPTALPAEMLTDRAPVEGRTSTAELIRPRVPVEQLGNLRTAAAAYLFGDSQLVAAYKTPIETVFKGFQIIFWPFVTITVNAGSALTIGAGQNVLFAWRIVIHEGGLVFAPHGNLKTEAVILEKVA